MNPRQRQGLMLVVIATAGLLGVFLLIADYVSSVSKQVGAKISVVTLVAPLNPYQAVSPNMLGEVSIPQKWAPHNAITDPGPLIGLVSPVALPAGTELEQGMLSQSPELTPGNVQMAILVDAETGDAGQLQPGDLVDILASFPSTSQGARNRTEVVVPSARVLTVGQLTGGSAASGNASVPVTFSLTEQQSLEVTYAESFGQKVRLAKVAPGTAAPAVTPPPYAPSP